MMKKQKKRNRQRMRRLAVFALVFALVLCAGGCKDSEWEYRPITNVNDLEGRRVGVNLAWDADYLLSDRQDMTVVRYDSFADIIMALEYDKIDAFAVDSLYWNLIQSNSIGLNRVEPSCGDVGYVAYFGAGLEDLLEKFNCFLEDYHQSEDYADHLARIEEFDGLNYTGPEIPLTGTGETIRVAILAEQYPRAYAIAGESIPTGFDLEAIKLFANEENYQLKFYITSYEDIVQGLRLGKYDLAVGYLSDVYREEVVTEGLLVSDPLDVASIYFIEKGQKEISVNLSELE